MFQCHYSTEVSGHYGKSLKDSALLFLVLGFFVGREERLCGVCMWGCLLFCSAWVCFDLGFFFIPHKVPALGQ